MTLREFMRFTEMKLRWSALGRLGNSRLLKSSYYWLIVVPLLAHLIIEVNPVIKIPLWGSEHILNLGLPFSWKMFYFSAVACAISSAVYSFGCPNIVAYYKNFSDFAEGRRGTDLIKSQMYKALTTREPISNPNHLINMFTDGYCQKLPDKMRDPHPWEDRFSVILEEAVIRDDKLEDTFEFVRSLSNLSNPKLRVFCGVCYSIAFLLILIVLVQNFIYVWQFV